MDNQECQDERESSSNTPSTSADEKKTYEFTSDEPPEPVPKDPPSMPPPHHPPPRPRAKTGSDSTADRPSTDKGHQRSLSGSTGNLTL